MKECVFCEIVDGRAPASVVYRDDVCIGLMDITPVNPGHLLIVPVKHATYLADLDPQTGGALFKAAQRLAAAVRGDGFGHRFPPTYGQQPTREQLDSHASAIAVAMGAGGRRG